MHQVKSFKNFDEVKEYMARQKLINSGALLAKKFEEYKNAGLLDDRQIAQFQKGRLLDESDAGKINQELEEERLSDCCGVKISADGAFCTGCKEHI